MKKIVTVVLAVIMVFATTFSFAACTKPNELSEMDRIIQEVEAMTLEELEAKAKEEIGTNKLLLNGNTSGLARAGAAFKAKYNIDFEAITNLKDSELYTKIGVACDKDEYYADVVLIQDANSLKDQVVQGNFFNYLPNGFTDLTDDDKDPLTGVYFNKLFIYNKTGATPDLTNVWQLGGAKTDAGHISGFSFQSPIGESINMNFLIMLTSPASCEKLKVAYKAFYGTEWSKPAAYESIGHQFVAGLIANVSTWHTSDTTAVKDVGNGKIPAGTIVYAPLSKYKDAEKETPGSTAAMSTSGLKNYNVAGFDGFMYKMYLQLLKTTKYPYAACLFINYMTTSEAFLASFVGDIGYYSVNTTAPIASGDQSLAYWKSKLIVEDGDYIYGAYDKVSKFVSAEVNR